MIHRYKRFLWFILFNGIYANAADHESRPKTNESFKLVVSDSLMNLLDIEGIKIPEVEKLLENAAVCEDCILAKIKTAAKEKSLFKAIPSIQAAHQCFVNESGNKLSKASLDDALTIISDDFDNKPLFAIIEKAISYIVNIIVARGNIDISYEWLIKFSDQHVWTAKIKPTVVSYLVFIRRVFLIKAKNITYIFDDEQEGQ